jgi:hypothetical protein
MAHSLNRRYPVDELVSTRSGLSGVGDRPGRQYLRPRGQVDRDRWIVAVEIDNVGRPTRAASRRRVSIISSLSLFSGAAMDFRRPVMTGMATSATIAISSTLRNQMRIVPFHDSDYQRSRNRRPR